MIWASCAVSSSCWRDNVFAERLWRSVKYEEVYLRAYDTVSEVRAGLTRYSQFFNARRPHGGLRSRTSGPLRVR